MVRSGRSAPIVRAAGHDRHRLPGRDHFELVLEGFDERAVGGSPPVRPGIDPPERAPRRVRVANPWHRFVGDVVDGDRLLAGQPVIPWHHHHPGLVVQDRDVQLVGRERQPGHDRVHPVVEQRLARHVPVQVHGAYVGVRLLSPHFAHRRRDDEPGRIADGDPAGLGCGPSLRGGPCRSAQQRFCRRQEDLAGLGESGALRGAIQQPRAQLLFEPTDLSAQRRLRHPQGSGGAAEVPVIGHHHEVAHQPQVEIG